MKPQLALAMMWATISDGHTDLSDLLLLLAFVVFVAIALLEIMRSTTDLVRVGFATGGALVALALFVL